MRRGSYPHGDASRRSTTATPGRCSATTATGRTTPAAPPPPAAVAPTVGGEILKGVTLADLSIIDCCQNAIIETGGASHGTFTIAQHFTLTSQWLDPQQHVTAATMQHYDYIVHDSLIKSMPQGTMTYSLAELVEMNEDFTTAGFRLRAGLKFHDGSPLTTEDVKWNYENYAGFRASLFQNALDKTKGDNNSGIEIVDDRTIIFYFSQPFIDFLYVYNGGSSGIGWIVPSDYYEQVGAEGFAANPIGAGPFEFVSQDPGAEFVFKAWPDYWRKVPEVQNLIVKGIGGAPTPRLAGILTGELDLTYGFTGPIFPKFLEEAEKGNLRWDPNYSSVFILFFPGWEDADSPFNDKRVREAISLGINREFLSQTETQGFAVQWGNWVPADMPDVLELPVPTYDLVKARQLMEAAGYGASNKLSLPGFIPFNPYLNMGETIINDLAEIHIDVPLEVYEGPEYRRKRSQGRDGYSNNATILKSIGLLVGTQMTNAFVYADCDSKASFICDREQLQPLLQQYKSSLDFEERDRISKEFQRVLIEEFYVVPLYLNPFVHLIGPNVLPAGDTDVHDYWDTPLSPYAYPWEDWSVVE